VGTLFVLLLFFVVTVRLVIPLISVPSTSREDELALVEASFFDGMGLRQRRRLTKVLREFHSPGERQKLAALRRLQDESRSKPLPIIEAWRYSRGFRSICAFRLRDGRQLEMMIYDPARAESIVRIWRGKPDTALRLTWVASLGWQCSLHLPQSTNGAPEAQALAWSARVTSW
jgi:hypothetical protein